MKYQFDNEAFTTKLRLWLDVHTGQEAEQATGMDYSTLWRYCNGMTPRADRLADICNALGVWPTVFYRKVAEQQEIC